MRRAPETAKGELISAQLDTKSMCRADGLHFVRCEIEVPLVGIVGPPLGFICWVEVKQHDYEQLLAFRENKDSEPFSDLVAGTLANPVAGVPDSYGARVRFEVRKDDPTPYVKWVAPRTKLAVRIKAGASASFWHEVASTLPRKA